MGYGSTVDAVVGKLSRLLHVRSAQSDTSGDLAPYLDIPLAELFPAPPGFPAIKKVPGRAFRGRVVDTLSWASAHRPLSPTYRALHETRYAKNLTAYARWMHASGGRKRRSILLYVHGWLEPGAWVEELTLMPSWYRAMGVDVAHIQLPFHGRRRTRGQLFHGEWFWTGDLVRSIEAVRQTVIDTRSAVAYFRDIGYEEVGIAGMSLGGSIAMLTACLEPTPDYVIPIVAHLELLEAVESAPVLWRMKADLERFGVDEAKRRDIFSRLAVSHASPLLPRDRQLWIAAREDNYLRAALVEKQRVRWGEPPVLWLETGHMTFPLAMREITAAMTRVPRIVDALAAGAASRPSLAVNVTANRSMACS